MTLNGLKPAQNEIVKNAVKNLLPTHISVNDVKEIYDPIQTHAIYNVPVGMLNDLKAKLKTVGARKFRKVKSAGDLVILCFNGNNIFPNK